MVFGLKTFQEKQIEAKGRDYDYDVSALKRRIKELEGRMTVLTREQDAALMAYIDELVTALRNLVDAVKCGEAVSGSGAEAMGEAERVLQKSAEPT